MSSHKLWVIIVAVLVLGFGLLAITFQVQTTEALVNSVINGGGGTAPIKFDLRILLQPFDLLNGKYQGDQAISVLIGWGVELAFLVFVVGFEVAHGGISKGNRKAADLFASGLVIVALINAWADFTYGSGGSWIGHLFFALIMSFIVAFFPLAGASMLEGTFGHGGRGGTVAAGH